MRRVIAALRTTDALATAIATYGIPLLVLTTTGSSTLTGLAFVVEWGPRLTAYAIGGSALDAFRTITLLRLTSVTRAALLTAAAATLSALAPAGPAATAVVLATGATSGILGQISFMGTETLGAHLTRQAAHDGHRIQACQVAIDQAALLAAPLLGSLLLLASPQALLVAVALLSALAALTTTLVQDTTADAPPPKRTSVVAGLVTGYRTVRAIPALTWLVIGLMASNFAVGAFQASSPITLLDTFGRSSLQTGAVWSAAGVASLVTLSLCGRAVDRWGLWPVGAAAAAAACLACLTAAVAGTFALYAVSVAVLMGAEGATTVVLRTLRARLIPQDLFGVTFAATAVLVVVPMPVAGLMVAAVPAPSLPALLLAAAALQAFAMTAALIGLWRHRDSYTPPAPASASTTGRQRRLFPRCHTQHSTPSTNTRHLEGTP
ncbi:MFS transporter [Streptomyces noursei]|uniref:MFS transporter n=1 Tax=Streptomyces noursei TaxID=1971 RepID=UPI00081C8250|nr:integral membrane protein [Streptomyces noursei ATCC 11455]ANZ21921.1 integral membrane protein [Streptomyces noursei ATCC 11455]MCZ0996517.1 MFS transporter [Streptomyces noursei]